MTENEKEILRMLQQTNDVDPLRRAEIMMTEFFETTVRAIYESEDW